MTDLVFVVVVVLLVAISVLVLVRQAKKGRLENTDPPVEVSKRARSIQAALILIWFAILAIGAARDGREFGAVVATVGAVGAAAHIAISIGVKGHRG